MTFFLCELYLWSSRNLYAIPDSVIGCHSYHEKGEQFNTKEQPYFEEKQQFIESRDLVWSPRNKTKRPEKLKDNLKEVEDVMSQYHCIDMKWKTRNILQLIMNNGCVISFVIASTSGDVEKILLDKSMIGKFSSHTLCCSKLTDQFMISSFPDTSRIDYAYFTKRPSLSEAAVRLEKLASWEPKVIQLDIPGPKGRRLDRKFSCNNHNDHILIWWMTASDEAWPWSPMFTDKERANTVVLHANGPSVDVLCFTRTENDPLYMTFSHSQSQQILAIEESTGPRGENLIFTCKYDIIRSKIQRTSMTAIPFKSDIVCQCFSPGEDKVILGCSDGSIVMHDDQKKLTQITSSSIKPACICWHPNGTVIFVGSSRGDIQIFDIALSCLRIQLVEEEINPEKYLSVSRFFRFPPLLNNMEWCPYDPASKNTSNYVDSLFLSFDKGPPVLLQFNLGILSHERCSSTELVKEYIKHRQIDEAISLLTCLNWDVEGQICYHCLSTIVNHLLRQPLNAEREAQLEASLATFYAPKPAITESVIFEFRDPISRLARRFFHYLLRYARFDKAFLLAVDIGAKDLFMDIYYMALDKGETALADVAKKKTQVEAMHGIDNELTLDDGYVQDVQNHQYNRRSNPNVDFLPRSRQHPWQSDQNYISEHLSSDYKVSQQNNHQDNISDNSFAREFGDLVIDRELVSDYTNALMGSNYSPDTRK